MSKISPLVDSLISSIQCLPGVGPKTARRMVLHLLEKDRAIEDSNQFRGKYFILHGQLSPIDNIGPDELGLNQLVELVSSKERELKEVILATSSTLEGEATSQLIYDSLKEKDSIKLTRLAQGVPLGGELEYVDGGTIMHALSRRVEM